MKTLLPLLVLLSCNVLANDLPEHIAVCADCHGDKGISSESDVPTIAGASDVFISDSLFAYREGERIAVESKYRHGDTSRPATDMQKIAKELSEEQIADIAGYFSQQKFIAAKQSFDPGLAAQGEKIHTIKCAKCHEDGGSSADDDAGILAGQWTPYMKQAFKLYRSGERVMIDKMKVKMEQLDDQEVEALLHYYASQQ
ncbi:c-type cytochrome [Shewanella salipaludis]|uniref:C-type cytochrome n=1 Tax=Shewanella salipaludis TaxID=2723052 RepID=A0A972FW14_9GAMM|nr:c-type cytochrome [Shewanella salipaludis]NMH66657.1 c-type cytochrome [Shewanella salipaludis]